MRGWASILKSALSLGLQAAWPAAVAWARRGYFRPPDWSAIRPRTVALVACHWIGDTFWATQVAPVLKERFAGAQIYAVTKPLCVDLWHGLLPPERVLPAGEVVSDRRREAASWSAIRRRARELRSVGFDLAIDLTGNRYSAWFSFLLRPRWSLGFDGGELGWLYTQRVGIPAGRHLSEQPFRLVEPLLAGQNCPFAYSLPLRPPTPTCQPRALLEALWLAGRRYCVVAPGAGWAAKQWPLERFAQVAGMLQARGLTVVVVGSAAERPLCEALARAIGGSACLFVGEPLGRLVALLSGADGVLTNDSGLAHLAAAMDSSNATGDGNASEGNPPRLVEGTTAGKKIAAVFTGTTDPRLCRPLGREGLVRVFQADSSAESIAAHLLG